MGVVDHHFGLLQDLCLKSHKDHISVITPVMFEHISEEQQSHQKQAVGSTAPSRLSQTKALPRLTPPNKSALWKKCYWVIDQAEAETVGDHRDQTAHLDKWRNPEWRAQPSGEKEGFLSSAKGWGSSTVAANVEFPQLAPWRAERSWLKLSDASTANPGKSKHTFHLHSPQLCSPTDKFIPDTLKDGRQLVRDGCHLDATRWAGLSKGVSKHSKVMVPSQWNDPISTG